MAPAHLDVAPPTPDAPRDLAESLHELHDLLDELAPRQWKGTPSEARSAAAWVRVQAIRSDLKNLLSADVAAGQLVDGQLPGDALPVQEAPGSVAAQVDAVRDQLQDLARRMDYAVPALLQGVALPPGEYPVAEALQRGWNEFRLALAPAYETLATELRRLDLAVPSLRRNNLSRKFFHVLGGLGALGLLQHILTVESAIWVAGGVALAGWAMEGARRVSPRVNRFLMWVFGPVAHPHEAHGINSSTWFASAVAVLALMQHLDAASVGLAVLAVGDPAAALVGRRFGKHRLRNGRSLEGTVAFTLFGGAAAFVALSVYAGHLAPGVAALVALGGAVPAAAAELLSDRLDDNLVVPVVAALGALGTLMLLGL